MWKRIYEASGLAAIIFAVVTIMTTVPVTTARENAISWLNMIPDWILTNSGMYFWFFFFLTVGLWAWRGFVKYEADFKNVAADAGSAVETKELAPRRPDVWFQQAAFYIALGCWPDVSRSVFGDDPQVPSGENLKVAHALKDMHQKARNGELSVWGKFPLTIVGASRSSLFELIPCDHWRDHRVEYMDLIRFSDPSDVMTTKDVIKLHGSWCALKVNRENVERLWPARNLKTLDFKQWDSMEFFELYEAACLSFDLIPVLPLPSLPQELYDEWRQTWLIKQRNFLAVQCTSSEAAKSGVETALGLNDETFNPHMRVSRKALIEWCEAHAMRPRFLFAYRRGEAV